MLVENFIALRLGLVGHGDFERELNRLYSPLAGGDLRPGDVGLSPGDFTSCFTSSSSVILAGSNEDFGSDFGYPVAVGGYTGGGPWTVHRTAFHHHMAEALIWTLFVRRVHVRHISTTFTR